MTLCHIIKNLFIWFTIICMKKKKRERKKKKRNIWINKETFIWHDEKVTIA